MCKLGFNLAQFLQRKLGRCDETQLSNHCTTFLLFRVTLDIKITELGFWPLGQTNE